MQKVEADMELELGLGMAAEGGGEDEDGVNSNDDYMNFKDAEGLMDLL